MKINRKKTRRINVGSVPIGDGAPVAIQSMTTTDTRDIEATVAQIESLATVGCEIIRLAVVDMEAAEAVGKIRLRSPIPIVADIHFDYHLALKVLDGAIDAVRINPGNIGNQNKVRAIVDRCRDRGIPIRIGVNAGSLENDLLERYGHPTPEAMVESALGHVHLLEKENFHDIKISLKASNVPDTIDAYTLMSERCDYPLHIGVSEAGPLLSGTVKSSVGLGYLLANGIGDTIRVSLAADPAEEVKVAWGILKSLGLRSRGVNIIACPTCGRLEIDVVGIAQRVEERLAHISETMDVSILGCVVNGIGEGKEADLGIAGGPGVGIYFENGEVVKKIKDVEIEEFIIAKVEERVEKIRREGIDPRTNPLKNGLPMHPAMGGAR
jgi:(E)-4-hydroxy-3-methylbut-2-enyl-diphosphate synthase